MLRKLKRKAQPLYRLFPCCRLCHLVLVFLSVYSYTSCFTSQPHSGSSFFNSSKILGLLVLPPAHFTILYKHCLYQYKTKVVISNKTGKCLPTNMPMGLQTEPGLLIPLRGSTREGKRPLRRMQERLKRTEHCHL